jgi:FkbM family methyltransferase
MRVLNYAVLDLMKDQWTGMFLPGHIRKTLAQLSINCVIDVGANRGDYGAMLRSVGYSGRIVSVEPQADIYSKLLRRTSGDHAWRALNFALGDADEIRELKVYAASDLSSFLASTPTMVQNLGNSHVIRVAPVAVKRLDTIFAQIVDGIAEPRIFLKMDTQGYDLAVMRGATRSINHILGVQSEISIIPLYEGMPTYLEALAYYRDLGLEPTGIFTVIVDRETRHILELDAVLTRRPARP